MISIRTKYLPFTDTKPCRIKAYADSKGGQSLTLSISAIPDKCQHDEEQHCYVAKLLCRKTGWTGELISGGTKEGYVFVFLPDKFFKVKEVLSSILDEINQDNKEMSKYSSSDSANRELLRHSDFENAIQAQNACNVSGLIHALSEVLPRIWANLRSNTEDLSPIQGNHPDSHPIVQLYVYQIAYLTKLTAGVENPVGWDWTKAYQYCDKQSKKKGEQND